MKNIWILIVVFCLTSLQWGCKKDFLALRPDKALTVPSTFADFRALLDNSSEVMNYDPTLGTVSMDDFYLGENGLQGLSTALEQNAYMWASDIAQGQTLVDWNRMYQQVFYCNVVLEGLEKMDKVLKIDQNWGQIKGAALFYRASAFYNLVQSFTTAYRKETAKSDLGIPLRIDSDLNLIVKRASLEESYQRIVEDFKLAAQLLPKNELMLTRPVKNAAVAFLSRVHLVMGDYQNARIYAEQSLKENASLLDYNSLNLTAVRPFPVFFPNQQNVEVIFYSRMISFSYLNSALTYVDPVLYDSYQSDDLRKKAFFVERTASRYGFKGNYSGSSTFFSGLSTREMYLIKAECAARLGDFQEARSTLSALLTKRYKSGTVFPVISRDDDVLSSVLAERRKELVGTGQRWADLKRLNLDTRFARDLTRSINGVSYFLPANDKRYVFPIPLNEILLTGIQQNER